MQPFVVSPSADPTVTPRVAAGRARSAGAGSASYTAAAVTNLINAHGGLKLIDFRFDLLHAADLSYKADVTSWVVQAQINHDTTRPVHRTMSLQMAETAASQSVTITGDTITDAGISYLDDLIQAWCLIGVPGHTDIYGALNEWIHYPLGVFMFPQASVTMAGFALDRRAEMSDLSYIVSRAQALSGGNIGAPFTMPDGVALIDIVYRLLTNSPTAAGTGIAYDIPTSPSLTTIPGLGIPTARVGSTLHPWPDNIQVQAQSVANYTFSEGTSYLDIINQLLYWCSCEQLWVDENGHYCTDIRPFNGSYNGRTATYTYDSTVDSIIDYGGTETFSLDELANVVQVVVEDPSRDTFYAYAQNTNSASPLSLGRKGYAIVKTVRDSGVPITSADGTNWAQNYANIQLQEATMLTDTVSLPTSVNPAHQNKDVVALNIYQQYIAAGSPQNWPVIVGTSTVNTTTFSGTISAVSAGTQTFTITPAPGYLATGLGAGNSITVDAGTGSAETVSLSTYNPATGIGTATFAHSHGASTAGTVGPQIPPAVSTQLFVEMGWQITMQLTQPYASKPAGASGITTALEPQHSKMGHVMTHTLCRTTSLA